MDREIVEIDGRDWLVKLRPDLDIREPWKEWGCHGEVSDWTRRAKRPGERVLHKGRCGNLYYDFAGTMERAKRDGWGCSCQCHRTRGEKAACAVERDFRRLRAWCRDDWHYVVLEVCALDPDGEETGETESIGGFESDYWRDYLPDLIAEIFSREEEAREGAESMLA